MTPGAPLEALVQIGDVVTRYVRIGQGPPVILLFESEDVREASSGLAEALARRWRVVVPEPRAAVGGHGRLRDFAEALGLDRPGVVAAGSKGWVDAVERRLEAEREGVLGAVVALVEPCTDTGSIERRLRDDAVTPARPAWED